MHTEADQHKVMHELLDDLIAYCKSPGTAATFDPSVLRAKVIAVKDPLVRHNLQLRFLIFPNS